MDHLPRSEGMSPPCVPFLAQRRKYNPEDFHKIPEEYGYNDFEEFLHNGLLEHLNEDQNNEFLQSWLFFSLLSLVLDRDIDSNDFLTASSNTLHTKKLSTYINEWHDREAGRDHAQDPLLQQNNLHIRASMALSDARRFMTKHCSYALVDFDGRPPAAEESTVAEKQNDPIYLGLDKRMLLSVAILGEILQDERPKLVSRSEGRLEFWKSPETENQSWGCNEYVRNMLLENGCCMTEIRRREATLSQVRLIYYSCFIKPSLDHADCSESECKASNNLNEAMHFNSGSCNESMRCKSQGAEEELLVSIIQRGETPLATWTQSSGLSIQPYDLSNTNTKFGALSHSWQHGLLDSGKDARIGIDCNDRKMLACQLERLQEQFNKLVGSSAESIPFWVDVLCFPKQATIQGRAINQMKDIYSKADAVLVWDKSLLTRQRRSSDHMIEMNLRIRLGDWSCRLWTLQEAVLAKNLHVAFQDGTVSIGDLRKGREVARKDRSHDYHYVWAAGHPFSSAVWELRQPREDHVAAAWEAVQFLEVTELADETLVLASVLKLDVSELEDIGNTNTPKATVARLRMVTFLNMLNQTQRLGIPSGIIFLPPPTLANPELPETMAYSWAPLTWLSKQSYLYPLLPHKPATIADKGLLVTFPGVILHCSSKPMSHQKFWIPVDQSMHKWYKIYADPIKPWEVFWKEDFSVYNEPSIILPTERIRERWQTGVLVRTKGTLERGSVRWVKKLCRAWIRLETDPKVLKREIKKFREKSNEMVFGTRLQEGQRWCVEGSL